MRAHLIESFGEVILGQPEVVDQCGVWTTDASGQDGKLLSADDLRNTRLGVNGTYGSQCCSHGRVIACIVLEGIRKRRSGVRSFHLTGNITCQDLVDGTAQGQLTWRRGNGIA